ncbi:BA75_00741T0 [Komagataella pastoris]|uniref:BA75_00741T0 n=1 Tax=Komagataella pastoris TaxID=4922 RepID=A0A1B2J5Q8_PICPA|nr:BA75_00741T0 [Komagataella pastoris]
MKGSVRIRLARFGRKRQPVYNVVVAKARSARDSQPIEVIGTYNPIAPPLSPEQKLQGLVPTKDIQLDFQKSKYWLSVGAQPTPTIIRLFKKAGILPTEWPSTRVGPIVPEREVIQEKKDL